MRTIPISSTRYRQVRARIEDGDLLLFRRPNSLIARSTQGKYSHSAIALWRGDVLALAESREWIGARVVTLSSQVAANPGVIDVFKPKCPPRLKRYAADLMFRAAGHAYGYVAILRYTLARALLLNALLRWLHLASDPTDSKEPSFYEPKFCSTQTEWSYREAARVTAIAFDPHPGLPSQFITPNDQAHSPDFELAFGGLVP